MVRIWASWFACLIFPIVVFAARPAMPFPFRLPNGTVVNIAHRGGIADGYPENTLAAFRRAIAVGADVIELDLRATKDGKVVVMHDETLDRTTDGSGFVTNFTLEELKKFNAGGAEKIPTYEEVLDLVSNTGTKLLLDIKAGPMLDKQQVVRLTAKHRAISDVIVGVRSLDDLEDFQKLNPKIRSLGFIATPFDIPKFANHGVGIIRLWSWWIQLFPELVKKVQYLEKPVWITSGDASREELKRLIRMGVNGIITDRPGVLAELLVEIKASR